MAANIVTPNASGYASGATMPTGWHREGDDLVDQKAYKRRALYRGVRTSQDAAYAAIKTFYGVNLLSLSVTPTGAAQCDISVEYSTALGTVGGVNQDNEPVSEDTYQLQAISVPTALAAHPAFAAISGAILAIDDAFLRDERDRAIAAAAADASGAANKYLALKFAGVTQWDATGFSWRVTRHYSTRATISGIADAAAAVAAVGTVYTWANVQGHGKIEEPKYITVDAQGQAQAAASYEWRLAGLNISRTETNLDLTYEYQAAWKWAAALYSGGTWSPQIPSAQ